MKVTVETLYFIHEQVIFALYIRLLAQHPTLYIFCALYIDNLQVAECRVPPDPTFTLHSPYIMQPLVARDGISVLG